MPTASTKRRAAAIHAMGNVVPNDPLPHLSLKRAAEEGAAAAAAAKMAAAAAPPKSPAKTWLQKAASLTRKAGGWLKKKAQNTHNLVLGGRNGVVSRKPIGRALNWVGKMGRTAKRRIGKLGGRTRFYNKARTWKNWANQLVSRKARSAYRLGSVLKRGLAQQKIKNATERMLQLSRNRGAALANWHARPAGKFARMLR